MRTSGAENKSNYKWRITEYIDENKDQPIKLGVFRSIKEVQAIYEGLTAQRVADFFRNKSCGSKGKSKDVFSKISIEKLSIPCPKISIPCETF
jgi:hypothetical protein